MKKIALSIEQMKHLKELGVDFSNASMEWVELPTADSIMGKAIHYEWTLTIRCIKGKDTVPAFILQDIIEILPSFIKDYTLSIYYGSTIQYDKLDSCDGIEILQSACGDIILNNAYAMLCWCAENGYLKQK